MSLTRAALDNDRITFTLIAVALIAGMQAFVGLPQQMDPGFTVRTAQIITHFPGASPERVEDLVSNPIEQAIQAMPELDYVKSISRTGVSIVSAAFREEFSEMRPIFDDLRRKVGAVQLPSGVGQPAINDELGDIYPIVFTLSTDGFTERQRMDMAKDIRDELLLVDGVGRVQILGEQEERIFVEFTDARLSALGLSPDDVRASLQARNIILPGGQVEVGPESLALEPSGNFDSIEDIRRTILRLPDGSLAYLGDVVTVRRGYVDPPQGLVRANGYPAIALFINMSDGHNLVELGGRMKSFFEDMLRHYPHGVDFDLAFFQPQDVETKVDEFVSNVIQAIVIVLLVMLLSLGLRIGLIVSTLIPAAMIVTVFVMGTSGETINQMSLAALIIALGLLVDNAIVVVESVVVAMGQGRSAYDAAIDSCKELQVPLLVSSLTTASAFLPIYLAESAVGEYTGALFVVVSITLLVSWLLALTMIPLFCVKFMKPPKSTGLEAEQRGLLMRMYRSTLNWVLRHRWVSLAVVVLAFAGSLPLWSMVPKIFFPADERPFFMARLELPPGSTMEATEAMASRVDRFIEDELQAHPDRSEGITSWTSFLGETPQPFRLGYSPSPSQGGYCEIMVTVSSVPATYDAMDRLQRFVYAELPDAKPYIRMLSNGPIVEKPIQIRISGSDMSAIYDVVDDVKAKLRGYDGVININDNWGARTKKLAVTIDSERALRSGVSHQDVASSVQTFVSGMTATHYRDDEDSIPVVLRSVEQERRDIDRMKTLSVYSRRGVRPLAQVADLELEIEPASVLRRNRLRTVTVEAEVSGITAAEIFAKMTPILVEMEKDWPLGLRWTFGGEAESSGKANKSIGVKLPIAGMVILLLLVWQFNSIRKTIIVLSSIVLALIGVVLGLLGFGASFGFMTLLGVVSLAGIVINNAIVLIDRIRIEIEDNGMDPSEAVPHAAEQRLRPILLTTATTVASLIPLYLTGGLMWEPMAVAIMAGLIFSTALTLLVVPLLYAMMFRIPKV